MLKKVNEMHVPKLNEYLIRGVGYNWLGYRKALLDYIDYQEKQILARDERIIKLLKGEKENADADVSSDSSNINNREHRILSRISRCLRRSKKTKKRRFKGISNHERNVR